MKFSIDHRLKINPPKKGVKSRGQDWTAKINRDLGHFRVYPLRDRPTYYSKTKWDWTTATPYKEKSTW